MPLSRLRLAAVLAAATFLVVPVAQCDRAAKAAYAAEANAAAPAEKGTKKAIGDAPDGKQPSAKSRSELLAAERFELIKRRVAAAKIESDEADFPTQFSANPIFRYSDPARGYVAAAVWRLGDEGRPKALLTSELDRFKSGRPCISHEYSSLTTERFSITLDGMHWAPTGTLYEFKPIPNAPQPEKTPQRRFRQLRELAKRFAGHEVVEKERCELRLLSQPVDRYVPSGAERADGAVFFFTFGTNPEIVLLIESDGERWHYAAGRMAGADEIVLTLDSTIAWQGAPLQKGADSPFTGSVAPIDIPGVSADGREIEE